MTLPAGRNGVILGGLALLGTDSTGADWKTSSLSGWGKAAPTIDVQQKPRSHGGWADTSYLKPRYLTIAGRVFAPSSEVLTAALDSLNAACGLADTTLTVVEASRSRFVTVRQNDELQHQKINATMATWSVSLVALDPRKYSVSASGTCGLPTSSGGITFPVTYPLTNPAVVNQGSVVLANAGNTAAPVTVTINGPVVNPTVVHTSAVGQQIFTSSQTLAAGEFLTVDMANRLVLAQGQAGASRLGYVTSRGWSALDPGQNTFGFSAAAYDPNASITVTAPGGAWL